MLPYRASLVPYRSALVALDPSRPLARPAPLARPESDAARAQVSAARRAYEKEAAMGPAVADAGFKRHPEEFPVPDPKDASTPDAWVKRNPALVRLTGRHPLDRSSPNHMMDIAAQNPLKISPALFPPSKDASFI